MVFGFSLRNTITAIRGDLRTCWIGFPARSKRGASRTETAIAGKKVTISGVGGKNATATVRAKLKELIQFMQADVMDEWETGVALDGSAFGTDVLILSEENKASLQKQADRFLKFLAD